MVALFQPHGEKPFGKLINPFVKFGVGKPEITVGIDEKILIRMRLLFFPQYIT
jgi:hypothetical protein